MNYELRHEWNLPPIQYLLILIQSFVVFFCFMSLLFKKREKNLNMIYSNVIRQQQSNDNDMIMILSRQHNRFDSAEILIILFCFYYFRFIDSNLRLNKKKLDRITQ